MQLSQQDKIILMMQLKRNPELALLDLVDNMKKEILAQQSLEIENQLKDLSVKKGTAAEIAKILLATPQFMNMVQPKDGHTPTSYELLALIRPLIPTLRQPSDGDDGHTPTRAELLEIIRPLIPKIKQTALPSNADLIALVTPIVERAKKDLVMKPMTLAQTLNTLKGVLDPSVIKGWDSYFKNLENTIRSGGRSGKQMHGGGMKVVSGTNITIVRLANGTYQISSTGGSSTVYSDTIISGTIDGVNKIFTVTNTITSAIALYLANSIYQPGVDFTVTGAKEITMTAAPDNSLSGQPFWLSHS